MVTNVNVCEIEVGHIYFIVFAFDMIIFFRQPEVGRNMWTRGTSRLSAGCVLSYMTALPNALLDFMSASMLSAIWHGFFIGYYQSVRDFDFPT